MNCVSFFFLKDDELCLNYSKTFFKSKSTLECI